MKAELQAGDTYLQEIYPGVAEDTAVIHALDVPFTFADGNTVNALQIREYNPLDPEGSEEFKYYRSGFGLIAEEGIDGSGRVELIAQFDQREPNLDPSMFSQSLIINHRYWPLIPGDVYTCEVKTDEGLLRDGASYIALKTLDWNPLDIEAGAEFKYYTDGVGVVREEDETGEEQVDLVSRTQR